jgi:hypothetical protein
MLFPGRESMLRAASLAAVDHEDWMQDWPIEVSNPDRLADFLGLLEAHRDDWELTLWFLDLVLESARERADLETWSTRLFESIVLAVAATQSPPLIERLEYWACAGQLPEESFEVSPVVREALRKLTRSLC